MPTRSLPHRRCGTKTKNSHKNKKRSAWVGIYHGNGLSRQANLFELPLLSQINAPSLYIDLHAHGAVVTAHYLGVNRRRVNVAT